METNDDTVRFEEADDSTDSELEKIRAELAESEKKTLMAIADLENYRKRAVRNTQEQVRYAALPMMTELVESVDNLNRAIQSAEGDSGNSASLLEGVKMVASQIASILDANHCKPIDSVGKPFDPNLHEALQMQPSDEFPPNTVMLEVRTGYQLHDRVVRPAQVFVSTGPSRG